MRKAFWQRQQRWPHCPCSPAMSYLRAVLQDAAYSGSYTDMTAGPMTASVTCTTVLPYLRAVLHV